MRKNKQMITRRRNTKQWKLPEKSTTATTFIIQNRHFSNISNDGDNEDYIEIILPHSRYNSIFNLTENFQKEMNEHLNILQNYNNNNELNWKTVGLRPHNELDLCCMLKDNISKFKVFQNVMPENYAGFGYDTYCTRIKLKDMERIDVDWNITLESELRQFHDIYYIH